MTVGRDWRAFLMTALAPPHGGELDGKVLPTRHRGFMVFSVRAVAPGRRSASSTPGERSSSRATPATTSFCYSTVSFLSR